MPSTRESAGSVQASSPAVAGFAAGFRPGGLLAHHHLQSVISQVPWRRRRIRAAARGLLAASQPTLIDCGDGVSLQGFLSEPDSAADVGVLLLHGWEGSADSSYVLSAGSALFDAGYSVFRLNFRDHGETQGLNEGLFHSCRIAEVFSAAQQVRELFTGKRFAIVGQSLGGNFALRIAALASQARLPIDRVISVCPVLRPHSTMQALDDGLAIYRRYFLARWRRSLAAKADLFPKLYRFGDLRRFTSLTDMTAYFVERFTEYEQLDDYLNGYAVTGQLLEQLQVSTRVILAADDPIIPVADLAQLARPDCMELHLSERGGHCGFVDSLAGPSWIDREVLADLDRAMRQA